MNTTILNAFLYGQPVDVDGAGGLSLPQRSGILSQATLDAYLHADQGDFGMIPPAPVAPVASVSSGMAVRLASPDLGSVPGWFMQGDRHFGNDEAFSSTSGRLDQPYQLGDAIPADLEIRSWEDIEPYFQAVLSRLQTPGALTSVDQMEETFLQYNDVFSVFSNRHYLAKFRFDSKNKDPHLKALYKQIDAVKGPVQQMQARIQEAFLDHPLFAELPDDLYGPLKQRWQAKKRFYRVENQPLMDQLRALVSRYNEISGSVVVEIEGKRYLPAELSALLGSSDIELARSAWLAIREAWLDRSEELTTLFDQIMDLRERIADNAGVDSIRDIVFGGGDEVVWPHFSVDQALEMHESVAKHVVPIVEKMGQRHLQSIGVDKDERKPWHAGVIPEGLTPLAPYKDTDELLQLAIDMVSELSPDFAEHIELMRQAGHIDLDARDGKRTGGYMEDVPGVENLPVILANAPQNPGSQRALETTIHESGHAVHFRVMSHLPFLIRTMMTMEMAEVPSMGFELLTMESWDKAYSDPKDLLRAKISQLEGALSILPRVCAGDAFQHWLYTHPGHSADQREAAYIDIQKRFGAFDDQSWEGLEQYQGTLWQQVGHFYRYTFYYLQYGISQLGALQLYRNYKEDPEQTIANLVKGHRMGGTGFTDDIYKAWGIKFDFSSETIQEIAAFVEKELSALYQELDALA